MIPTVTEKEALDSLKGSDRRLAAAAETELWRIWCRSKDPEIDEVFRAGVIAMQQGKLDQAESLFTRVIELAPDFAEGWNKRATVRYLANNFPGSIADCRETIMRNPSHFGALSGQGLCHMSLGEYREAAVCFRSALEIHPHLEGVRENLNLAVSECTKGNGHLS